MSLIILANKIKKLEAVFGLKCKHHVLINNKEYARFELDFYTSTDYHVMRLDISSSDDGNTWEVGGSTMLDHIKNANNALKKEPYPFHHAWN